ncbi:MAG: Gldg family protein [Pseudomonadales bacterium]|nr:Gldg family protein [Pseudomonadales bacterium]
MSKSDTSTATNKANQHLAGRLSSTLMLVVIFGIFFAFTMLNNALFSSARIDLTENKLYTLTLGTRDLIAEIDEPIKFRFFFSQRASEDLTALRAYARRVQELLEEYQALAGGSINLEIIDPEPFSEEEDLAAQFGLQSVPVNNAGDELYFGLVGTNSVDDQLIISFFQPDKEEFLEYDISRIIHQLNSSRKPKVGLLSSLKIQGDIDTSTFQTTPAWVVIDQLTQQYEVVDVAMDATELPRDMQLLIIVHPKSLSDATLFAIDQFAMAGGRVLLFVDPLAEMERRPPGAMPTEPASDFSLLSNWGMQLRADTVLADSAAALNVGGSNGQSVRHLGILGLSAENFNSDDVSLASLESINVTTSGILDMVGRPESRIDILIQSSENAMPMASTEFQSLTDPEQLLKTFVPTGKRYTIAARISGKAVTAYPGGVDVETVPEAEAEAEAEAEVEGQGQGQVESTRDTQLHQAVLTATDKLNVIMVADTDILTDRLWVQVQNFFGQTIASPWANNGDFVLNSVDNLLGGSELISIRSRGRFSRPFTVVESLRLAAQSKYQKSADTLQRELEETEAELNEVESSQSDQNLLALSPEQEQAITQFQDEKLRIRKQLRDVRHQLDKDIEGLGATLKLINIIVLPLLLVLVIYAMRYTRGARVAG